MRWPADRKFTDAQGKILDHWRGPMGVLEPLLALSPAQFVALQSMIGAFLNPDEEADPGAAINLALPIDTEPLPAEDWLIEYKNSANAGRRVLISTLLALIPVPGQPVLLSSTALTGLSSVDITVPTGYTHLQVNTSFSLSGSGFSQIAFSNDNGSTFQNQYAQVFNNSAAQTATGSTPGNMHPASSSATDTVQSYLTVFDYLAAAGKRVEESGFLIGGAAASWFGTRFVLGAAPLTLIQLTTSAGTFDSGSTCSLYGIP